MDKKQRKIYRDCGLNNLILAYPDLDYKEIYHFHRVSQQIIQESLNKNPDFKIDKKERADDFADIFIKTRLSWDLIVDNNLELT